MQNIKIVEKHNRAVLSEGRNQGMGFAFLEKISNTIFHTVQPMSPCKDYLNEVVFTEATGIPSSAHGLYYRKKRNIIGNTTSYMVIDIQKNKNGYFSVSGLDYDGYVKLMLEKHKKIEVFINKFQRVFKDFIPCVITKVEGGYLVEFDSRWASNSYCISLFSLLLRIGIHYEKGTILQFLIQFRDTRFIDLQLLNSGIKNILQIQISKALPLGIPNKQIEHNNYCPHNDGILAWDGTYTNFTTKEDYESKKSKSTGMEKNEPKELSKN